jgi:predicted PurR-regulated permease PerM
MIRIWFWSGLLFLASGYRMPPKSGFPVFASTSPGRIALLQGLLIAAIVVAALYVGREVLVPLALAILLSFVLTPPLLLLRRLGAPRALGVAILVSSAFLLILTLGWLMSREAAQFAVELPHYQAILNEKINKITKSAADAPGIRKVTQALEELQQELANPGPDSSVGTVPIPPEQVGEDRKPVPVEIREPQPKPLELFQRLAGTLLPPIATAGIVLLFVIFILLQREDLRDRLIRLFGTSDLQRSTAAINDAAERLSRYFVTQLLINSAFGIFIAFGLWMIGVPSATVWGILAMLMRFVPYVGSFIAAAPPVLLAAIVDPGWTTFLLTAALFLVSELAMGQLVEPVVYGHGTGLSPIAIVIATVFWTWLWGPLGLLLATPLTVVLVVLGRHIEGLQFFDVLLGDEPALTPEQRFYQRLLTGDSAESADQLENCIKEGQTLVSCFDEVALKALQFAQHDAERGALEEENLERIEKTMREVIENLRDFEPHGSQKGNSEKSAGGLVSLTLIEENQELERLEPGDLAAGWEAEGAVVCIGGRTPLDDAAAALLSELLERLGLKARLLGSDAISPGHIVSLEVTDAKLVCLSYMSIDPSPAHVRYLIRRLRGIIPAGCTILVGYWAADGNGAVKTLKQTAGADAYATSLKQAAEVIINAARTPAAEKPMPKVARARVGEKTVSDAPLRLVREKSDD